MPFRLVHANYDRKTLRAYVELRDDDADGGEVIVTTIFSYRRSVTSHSTPAGGLRRPGRLQQLTKRFPANSHDAT